MLSKHGLAMAAHADFAACTIRAAHCIAAALLLSACELRTLFLKDTLPQLANESP